MRANVNARRATRKRADRIFQGFFLLAIGLAVLALAVLLADVISGGAKHLDWQFLTGFASRKWENSGIAAPLVGSFYVIGLTAAVALPVGISTAIYLEFYAGRNWLTRVLQTNIANLAGVPSIVYGLFGLAFFVRYLALDRSILAAALTMALLILPVIIVNTQEAIKAVPPSLAHGAYALGASKWQVIATVILPAALPGIFTGAILSLSRALGESAPLITVGAWAFISSIPKSPLDSFTVLPIQVWVWSSKPQAGFQEIAATAIIVLLVVLLTINGIAIFLRNKYQKKAEW
jgi:phosphate transport system permease protein